MLKIFEKLFKKKNQKRIRTETRSRTYNANVQGWLLTKSDRINHRIEKFAQSVKLHNNTIAAKDFLEFVKAMQIMIAQELTYQKYAEESKSESTKEKEAEKRWRCA